LFVCLCVALQKRKTGGYLSLKGQLLLF